MRKLQRPRVIDNEVSAGVEWEGSQSRQLSTSIIRPTIQASKMIFVAAASNFRSLSNDYTCMNFDKLSDIILD